MNQLLQNGNVFINGVFIKTNIVISDGFITEINGPSSFLEIDNTIDCSDVFIIPGFVDLHVHFREPGFSYKETIKTGSMAAARGGYTEVCLMPNLNPVPDCIENLNKELEIIKRDSPLKCIPYASISKGRMGVGELVNFNELKKYVVGFSDDGCGIQDEKLMAEAMMLAKKENVLIAAHCEDDTLLNNGYIHDGRYAKINGHKGISSKSEWGQIERDLELASKTGNRYHICHVSTKESVELIRNAKRAGVNVTSETAPHYLVLCEDDLQDEGCFKMNPPLRSNSDRLALIEGIIDGTIDVIATDHAPHSYEEKSKGLKGSLMGIVGLETSFPVLYTKLVKSGIISFEKLIKIMSLRPREILHDKGQAFNKGQALGEGQAFNFNSGLCVGDSADLAFLKLDYEYKIDSNSFLSMGKSTPFNGMSVFGENIRTMVNGRTIWEKNTTEK